MKKYLYPGAALALGIAGLLVRRWQLESCFDSLGLPVSGTASTLLIILVIVGMVLFFPMAFLLKGNKRDWEGTFDDGCPALWLTAAGELLAAGMYFFVQKEEEAPSAVFQLANFVLPVLTGAGLLAAAVSMGLLARKGKAEPVAAMLPGFSACFCLVNNYHFHANDPVVPEFCWTLLALAAGVLAWYQMAGFSLNRGRSRLTVYWSLAAVMLSIIPLSDALEGYMRVALVVQALFFMVQSVRLLDKLEIGLPTAKRGKRRK